MTSNVVQFTPPERIAIAYPSEDGLSWFEYAYTGDRLFLGEAPDPKPETVDAVDWSGIVRYSQNDPRWAALEYAGGTTFSAAGCYVTCVAMIVQKAYSEWVWMPHVVAERLRNFGAFSGSMLSNLDKVPEAFDRLAVGPEPRAAIHYRDTKADLERVVAELQYGPLIAEVAFDPNKPVTWVDASGVRHWNQHFILIVSLDAANDTAVIVDPWDGELKELTASRYAKSGWGASRIITGLRLLRIKK